MSRYNRYNGGWPVYVPAAERKLQATKMVASLKKKGQEVSPIIIEGRTIAKTFWGKAWCNNLNTYSDYENRLPRGRTYVRNGSVIDLAIDTGEVRALVSGSSIYKVNINMKTLSSENWQSIVEECAEKIDSLIELLQGKFSKSVMEVITREKTGLFPHPKELTMNCSCLDCARMCKHIAAVLYAIGVRLDDEPEKLFTLRACDHMELITKVDITGFGQAAESTREITENLSLLFGIDIDDSSIKIPEVKNRKKT